MICPRSNAPCSCEDHPGHRFCELPPPPPPSGRTSERLAIALQAANAPKAMVVAARAGCYDDFRSESATPIIDLVCDAKAAGLHAIAERAMDGEFDATKEEAEAWAAKQSGEMAGVLDALRQSKQ